MSAKKNNLSKKDITTSQHFISEKETRTNTNTLPENRNPNNHN